MSVTPELKQRIEADMAKLKPSEFRRPGKSIIKFTGEFSANLSQAEVDKPALITAKCDWNLLPYFLACFELLILALGERIGASPESSEELSSFQADMASAVRDRKILAVVASFIVRKSGDKNAANNYRKIQKGSGNIDRWIDILSFISMMREYPELASQINPGGQQIDEPYLEEAGNRAIKLLKMSGYVLENGVPRNVTVDRQNRLLTLCCNAQSYIKEYARAAFYDDMEYYNAHYAGDSDPSPAADDAEEVGPEPAAV